MNPMARMLEKITALAVMLALTTTLIAQDAARTPAHFAPAGAAVFIQIDNLAELRKDWENDPLAAFLQENLLGPSPAGWKAVQNLMGLRGDQIIDKYFGTSAAIVFMDADAQQPGLVITKVGREDIDYGIKRLGMQRSGTIGAFTTYSLQKNEALIAIGDGWVIVADPSVKNAAAKILEGDDNTLAGSDAFKTWSAKLPSDRFGTLYLRPGNDDTHAFALTRKGRDLSLHYRGQSQDFAPLFDMLGDGAPLEFGPLPHSTIAAISANIKPTPGPNPKQFNKFFPGKSFEKDILPYVGSPTVLFLGEVKGDSLQENPGLDVPVLGVAIQLRDRKLADEFDKAMNGLLIMLNFAAAQWDVPDVEVRTVEHSGATFTVAEVGALLATRTQRPELKALNLSYGRIGDWYVLCSQDQFFKQCIDADQDPSKNLASFAEFKAMPLEPHERPILTAILRPSALAAHVKTWLAHWEKVRPEVMKDASLSSETMEGQLVHIARLGVGLLEHYKSVSVQAYRQGQDMAARLDLIRK